MPDQPRSPGLQALHDRFINTPELRAVYEAETAAMAEEDARAEAAIAYLIEYGLTPESYARAWDEAEAKREDSRTPTERLP